MSIICYPPRLAGLVLEQESPPGNTATVSTKDLGMIVLRIKRVERSGSRPANTTQTIPDPNVGNRRPGDLCVGYVALRILD